MAGQRTSVTHNEMNKLPYIIAVDFDGTLVEDKFPEIGNPNLPLWAAMRKWQDNGARIVLWTCRDGQNLKDAVNYSECMGFVFDSVNRNIDEVIEMFNNDTRKIYANLYIDDKAISPHVGTYYDRWEPERDFTPWKKDVVRDAIGI